MLHGGQLADFVRTKEVAELEDNIGPMVTALCGRSTLRVAGRTEERGQKKKMHYEANNCSKYRMSLVHSLESSPPGAVVEHTARLKPNYAKNAYTTSRLLVVWMIMMKVCLCTRKEKNVGGRPTEKKNKWWRMMMIMMVVLRK